MAIVHEDLRNESLVIAHKLSHALQRSWLRGDIDDIERDGFACEDELDLLYVFLDLQVAGDGRDVDGQHCPFRLEADGSEGDEEVKDEEVKR
eukprot:m.254979 g.254979  ORF g.254979 m.254979 type:complete len:92 (+) comp18933_c0_seq1:227-502(+)